MSVPRSEYLSSVWADGIFGKHTSQNNISLSKSLINILENRVLFITGGAGSIGSAQTRAIVHLGANACIIGRSIEKTENAAKEIAKVRPGAKVLGIGGVDVRNVSCD
jgi:2,4-dienoyl-CoA reductase [(3E)-enoyl-CoA-producing], peroxisomal